MTRAGISITHHGLRLAEFLGLVPAGTHDVAQKMRVSGEALVKGGQMKVRRSIPACLRALSLLTIDHPPLLAALHAHVPVRRPQAARRQVGTPLLLCLSESFRQGLSGWPLHTRFSILARPLAANDLSHSTPCQRNDAGGYKSRSKRPPSPLSAGSRRRQRRPRASRRRPCRPCPPRARPGAGPGARSAAARRRPLRSRRPRA